ncbi:MAG: DUF58 domain-containing protein, partial [Actinomycetota bacterium]|nr:DUF58 domain-containing protein [Actinomycetota bacterium]
MKRVRKPALVICLGVVLYSIATNAGAGWLYVVSAIIGAVVAVSALAPWWNVRGIEATRRTPVLATAGEPFECALEIKNTGRLARHLLEIEDRFAGDVGRAVVVRVEGGGKSEIARYTIENPRRGVYTGGSLILESGAPFGLFYRRRRALVASEMVVYPRTFEVAGLPPSAVVDAERGDRSESSTLHRGHGGEFWGVREYRAGDPARLIAWKRSARGMPSGRLAVVELAQETHPPFELTLNLDPRAPQEAREMVVSAGASLLLYGLREGREVRAEAGPQRMSFPEEVTPDSILTWCAELQASRPPDPDGASVEIWPSIKKVDTTRKPRPSDAPEASEAQSVVLISCHGFAGASGRWMSPQEEREFVNKTEASGRRVAVLGPEVEEPWR